MLQTFSTDVAIVLRRCRIYIFWMLQLTMFLCCNRHSSWLSSFSMFRPLSIDVALTLFAGHRLFIWMVHMKQSSVAMVILECCISVSFILHAISGWWDVHNWCCTSKIVMLQYLIVHVSSSFFMIPMLRMGKRKAWNWLGNVWMRETGVHPCERVKLVGTRAPPVLFFSETPNVGRMLLATYHKQTRNIDANISRWMLHGRRFATLNTLFRNIVKVFRNIPRVAPRSTADRGLHPNRAAQHPSDASARIGRPGASSTE
jgi:hypothetical protein